MAERAVRSGMPISIDYTNQAEEGRQRLRARRARDMSFDVEAINSNSIPPQQRLAALQARQRKFAQDTANDEDAYVAAGERAYEQEQQAPIRNPTPVATPQLSPTEGLDAAMGETIRGNDGKLWKRTTVGWVQGELPVPQIVSRPQPMQKVERNFDPTDEERAGGPAYQKINNLPVNYEVQAKWQRKTGRRDYANL